MIDIKQLTEKDVGRWVEYRPNFGGSERGRIKGWNDKYIFVVYKCGGRWYKYQDFTGQSTKPEDLCFV